jgi:hypothetical protein
VPEIPKIIYFKHECMAYFTTCYKTRDETHFMEMVFGIMLTALNLKLANINKAMVPPSH